MPVLHAIVLGVTQGLSEFLPISSSGHLILVPWLLQWTELTRDPELNKTFDVALHMGTFGGALAYFWRDVLRLVTRDRRMGGLLLLSALPGAAVGALGEDVIVGTLSEEWLVGVMLIVFGIVLLAADRLVEKRGEGDFGVRAALIMGVAQASALQPGVSRSGVTMSAGRFLGFTRDAAARLSFLMSLPIIGGAGVYEGIDVMLSGGIPPGFGPAFVWGTVASAITGFAAVWALLRFVRTRSFAPFVGYRVVLGVAVIALAASPLR